VKVLVTGGAGFIGSHIVDGLLAAGHEVRVLDALVDQVHGEGAERPEYLSEDAELVVGQVTDREVLGRALDGIEVVLHNAAAVGVGQSMYEIADYVQANVMGTAVLLEELISRRDQIGKVVVASSMSNYGEGRYRTSDGELRAPPPRPVSQLDAREWEVLDSETGEPLTAVPTDEEKPLNPTSVYATTKRDQEELVLNVCRAYSIPGTALRYFNVYGTRQALSNPYTGVAAIFSARILNDQPPLIFEDGKQSRDFTHVDDIVQANLLVLEREEANDRVFNVGTGRSTNLIELSSLLLEHLGKSGKLEPEMVGQFREGDIRHCYADITALSELGFSPKVALEDGVEALVGWVSQQTSEDRVPGALAELEQRSLIR
jgi:dTDP-L-rhamnose 4-epimerase